MSVDMNSGDQCFTGPAAHIAETLEWQRLAEVVGARADERLLEVGCGAGRHVALFRKRGVDVIGLDDDSQRVKAARRRLDNPHLIHHGQAEELPFEDNTFDVVILNQTLNFCLNPEAALAEAARVANRRLIIEVINPASWLGVKLRLTGTGRLPRHWHHPLALKHLVRQVVGPSPVFISSILLLPQSLLPSLKALETAEWLSGHRWGGLMFMKVDIRYTHRTTPLRSRVKLAGARSRTRLPTGSVLGRCPAEAPAAGGKRPARRSGPPSGGPPAAWPGTCGAG